jgi:hypothetical protein
VETVHVRGLAGLKARIKADLDKKRRRIRSAVRRVAGAGVKVAEKNAPEAFGNLRLSGDLVDGSNGPVIRFSAPHAAALEVGSRPHTPPLAPLVAWVKLRGMQGLTAKGRLTRKKTVGRYIQGRIREESRKPRKATDLAAVMAVARSIQMAIARRGTKPTWYLRRALEEIRPMLAARVTEAVKGKG